MQLMTPGDKEILEQLRRTTVERLSAAFDQTKPVALVDFPIHTNVGDHMIYAGERAYLSRMGVKVAYLSDVRRFDAAILRSRLKHGTVLINGGGNFGDIWPEHQAFKESVVTALPDYPIVQLPQSIFFQNRENAKRANHVLSQHFDFTLMIRDTASVERAASMLPDIKTVFVPDMALGWTPDFDRTLQSTANRLVVLARTDREASSEVSSGITPLLQNGDRIVDWDMNWPERLAYWLARVPSKASNGVGENAKRTWLYPAIERSFHVINKVNLTSGLRTFSDASIVITDRLHAHVLATLMGIPNIALDNSYGKVKSLYDDYTGRFGTSHFASNNDELSESLRALRLDCGHR